MKDDFLVERIDEKIHYIVHCSECGKKYEDTVEPFLSTNWDCDSEVCKKNWDKYYNGEHGYLLKAGWIDFSVDYDMFEEAEKRWEEKNKLKLKNKYKEVRII